MKICMPTIGKGGLDYSVGEYFGRLSTYTIVDIETNEVKVSPNTNHHIGGQGDPPEIMARERVNIMVCQRFGRRASTFEDFGITVYIEASGTVRGAVDTFKQGNLQKASESDGCGKHAFRDRHHL